jgi:hypothetical protein
VKQKKHAPARTRVTFLHSLQTRPSNPLARASACLAAAIFAASAGFGSSSFMPDSSFIMAALSKQAAQNAAVFFEGAPITRRLRHDQQTSVAVRVGEINFVMPAALDPGGDVMHG